MVSSRFLQSKYAGLPFCALILATQVSGAGNSVSPNPEAASAILRGLPMAFEPNAGRWDSGVKFSARTGDYRLFLSSKGAALKANRPDGKTVSISLLNSNPDPRISGLDALPVRTNYFLGSKRSNWRAGVANYAKVRYEEVYPGVDLVYYGAGSELEYDFLVRPGADPGRIRLKFSGADRVRITGDGNLEVETAGARLVQRIPAVYQEREGTARKEIQGRFKLLAKDVAGFEIGEYDRRLPLTIDPALRYSSLIGGSGSDVVTAVKIDAAGKVYVTGYMSNATDVTAPGNAFQTAASGGADIFVAKIDPAATGPASLLYLTFIGGSGNDIPNAMALDALGNVYLTGSTRSINFPLGGSTPSANLNTVSDGSITGVSDAFILKLQPAIAGLDAVQYSTFLGGKDEDAGTGIDVDAQGNVYVTGYTRSEDFQLTSSAYQSVRWGNQDAFVVKMNTSSGSPLLYSSYLGGEVTDVGRSILVAPSGLVYIAANTFSENFPLAGQPFRFSPKGGGDIVVSQMDLTKSGLASLLYTTYLGGSGLDEVSKLGLDSRGRVLLVGTTLSDDFPVTGNAIKASLTGVANAFVTRLDLAATGDAVLSYSTYLGGSGGDVAYDMTSDTAGNVYVSGYTLSPDFPTTQDALQQGSGGGINVFLSKLSLADALPALTYSTYIGKEGTNVGNAVAVAADGTICVGGQAAIRSIDTTEGAFQDSSTGGVSDGFVMVLR
jgi:hypothetical protein